jgi:ankyrin repeat protein
LVFFSLAGLNQQLIEMAGNGNVQGVQNLLEKGADVNAKDSLGKTPLRWAVDSNNAEIVRTLLAAEAK